MPYSVKTNVVSDRVEILIAPRTADNTPVAIPSLAVADAGGDATWIAVGTYTGGSMKFTGEPTSYEDQAGGVNLLGIATKLEVPALETDTAKLTALEAFYGKFVDIVCRVIGSAAYHRFNKMSVTMGADFPFNLKDPNKLPITATGIAAKLSSVYSRGTLI